MQLGSGMYRMYRTHLLKKNQLCKLNADWLLSYGQEQSKISLDRAEQAEEEQAQDMKNVIWHNPTNHTLDSPEVWWSMCCKSYTNTKNTKHKSMARIWRKWRFRRENLPGQVAKKRGRAQGRAEAMWFETDSRAIFLRKERESQEDTTNQEMCWAAMLTKCMLRIRFLQLKFPCQQVFGCQAGGFQHRTTGWEYWVNTGSAWPSSFNSAYSCGVQCFALFYRVISHSMVLSCRKQKLQRRERWPSLGSSLLHNFHCHGNHET